MAEQILEGGPEKREWFWRLPHTRYFSSGAETYIIFIISSGAYSPAVILHLGHMPLRFTRLWLCTLL
jgi:hypothetical protein